MASTPTLQIHHGHDKNTPIITGCPFPESVDLANGATVTFEDGSSTTAQAERLTNRTAGGSRWWELSFLSQDTHVAKVQPASAADDGPSICEAADDAVHLDNGHIRVSLAKDASVAPVSIAWQKSDGTLTPIIDTQELGSCSEPADDQRTINVLRNGSIRAQVEVLGRLVGSGGEMQYRLTLEVWRDQPGVRVDWMLTNLLPGKLHLTVTRATLQGDWNVGGKADRVFRQNAYSERWISRDVVNPDRVQLVADNTCSDTHVADPAMLLDDSEYPFYCAPPTVGTQNWLELCGETGRVSAQLVDFTQTRPNGITSEGNQLSYDMTLPGYPLQWMQGWRKEQTLLLSFADNSETVTPSDLAAKAVALFALGRAQPTAETLREQSCFELDRILEFVPGKNLRFSSILNSLCNLVSKGSKFDLGDTPDWHYTRGYATSAHSYHPQPPHDQFPRGMSHTGYVFPDVLKYFLEPVWTNNEYDIIHAIATELMRTGKDDHFKMLRWTSRHNVEIDFLSYSDDEQHHRASPFHSHFHNRKGAITSHFWTQGLIQYYCLTGDRDVLEVAKALGDKIIEVNNNPKFREWKFDREIGWALLALCCLAEAGFDEFTDEAAKIAKFLQEYDRKAFSGAVKLSAGKAGRTLERQMVDAGFGYSSMVEALDRFETMAGDEKSSQWYTQLLHDIKDAVWEKVSEGELATIRNMTGLIMAIGYERTGDKDFLLAGRLMLEAYLDPTTGGSDVSATAGTEKGQVKPCAMAYRGLHRLLGALDDAGELDQFEYPALLAHKALKK